MRLSATSSPLFSVLLFLVFSHAALGFNFKFYRLKGCRDELPDKIETYGPDGGDDPDNPGCIHSHNDGNTAGVIVTSTGPVDNKFGVRFFNNKDCDPSGTNTIGTSFGDDGCANTGDAGWQSFRVVCLCEKCDEACLTP